MAARVLRVVAITRSPVAETPRSAQSERGFRGRGRARARFASFTARGSVLCGTDPAVVLGEHRHKVRSSRLFQEDLLTTFQNEIENRLLELGFEEAGRGPATERVGRTA